jgi:hypothetical protein
MVRADQPSQGGTQRQSASPQIDWGVMLPSLLYTDRLRWQINDF